MRLLPIFTAAALAASAAQAQTTPAQGAPEQWPTPAAQQQQPQPIRSNAASEPWRPEELRKLPANNVVPAPDGSWAAPAAAPTAAPVAQPGWDSLGSGAIPALPLEVMQTQGGIRYINGGVGDEELAQLKAQAPDYNLQVMLSAPKGEFISDVTLRILDKTGTPLLLVQDAGPYLYVKLPAGEYTLDTVTPEEPAVKTRKLRVPATGALKQHVVYNQK